MLPLDQHVQDRFKELSGPLIKQDDPELVRFLREEMIDPPRPFVRKLSHLLYKTPQAEEVDRILKGKVRIQGTETSYNWFMLIAHTQQCQDQTELHC